MDHFSYRGYIVDNYVNSVKLGLLSMLASMLLLTFSVFGTSAAKMRVVTTSSEIKCIVKYHHLTCRWYQVYLAWHPGDSIERLI